MTALTRAPYCAALRCADVALYRGKREGRGTYRFFEQSMDEELMARAAHESEAPDGDLKAAD